MSWLPFGYRRLTRRVKRLVPKRLRTAVRRRLKAASSTSPPSPLKRAMAAAQAASQAQDWATAAVRWRAVIDDVSDEAPARAYARLARAHRRLGEFDACRLALEQGLTAHPGDLGLMSERAELAMEREDWLDAVVRWEAILAAGDGASARLWARASRAYRGIGDYATADARLARAHALDPDHLEVAVEEVRLALHRYRSADEDERIAWRERLARAAATLQRIHRSGASTQSSLTALGDAAMALRDWSTAIDTWQAAAAEYPQLAAKASLRQAQACRYAGRIGDARVALAKVTAPVTGSAAYRAEARSLSRQVGRWAAAETARLALLRAGTGEPEAVQRLISGALLLYGYTPEQVVAAGPLVTELGRIAASAAPDADAPAPTTVAHQLEMLDGHHVGGRDRDIVLVSGFLYSGAGAVFDYLLEHPGVLAPFGLHEVGFLKKPANLGDLIDNAGDELTVPQIIEVVLANVFGLGQTGRSLFTHALESPAGPARVLGRCRQAVIELADAVASPPQQRTEATERAIRRLVDGIITELTPADMVAVLNNAVIAHQLDRLRLFAQARAVAVLRDPRDQYVSQRLESPQPLDHASFISLMQERFATFTALLDDPDLRRHITLVRFEDFVEHEPARRDLVRRLGLSTGDGRRDPLPQRFFPDRSRRNIGVHRSYPHQDEITAVHTALREVVATIVDRAPSSGPRTPRAS